MLFVCALVFVSLSCSFCLIFQKKWQKAYQSTIDVDEEKSKFHKFNVSLKQEPSVNVVLPEDPRTRRRRLYKLASEPKAKFPFQPRNFYSLVIENKEIIKTLSLLSSCTSQIKPVRVLRLSSHLIYVTCTVLLNLRILC